MLPPSHLPSRQQEVVKDKQEPKQTTTSTTFILLPTHYRQNGQGWYVYVRFLCTSLDDVDAGVHGVSTFERDAGLSSLLWVGDIVVLSLRCLNHSLGFTSTWDSCSSTAEDGAGWTAGSGTGTGTMTLLAPPPLARLPALAPSMYSGRKSLVMGIGANYGNG